MPVWACLASWLSHSLSPPASLCRVPQCFASAGLFPGAVLQLGVDSLCTLPLQVLSVRLLGSEDDAGHARCVCGWVGGSGAWMLLYQWKSGGLAYRVCVCCVCVCVVLCVHVSLPACLRV